MFKTTCISDLINSIPNDTPVTVSKFLRFQFLSKNEISQAMDTLHVHGMLGFIPFGQELMDELDMEFEPGIYALQLIPCKELDEAPVVLCMENQVVTIASKLRFFIPGMILFQKTNGNADMLTETEILEITTFADGFGESSYVPALLRGFGLQGEELPGSENMLRYLQENRELFQNLEDDSVISIKADSLSVALDFPLTEDKVRDLTVQYPKYLDAWEQLLLYHCIHRTEYDVSEILWNILKGNFLGNPFREILFVEEFSLKLGLGDELTRRMRQLSDQHPKLILEYPGLWSAVCEYIEDTMSYDGRKHLQFAMEIKKYDPLMAYRQAIISGYFSGRLKLNKQFQNVELFLEQLTKEQGWKAIEEYFEYIKRR